MNPKLDQEATDYYGRNYASFLANKTSNTLIISVVLAQAKKTDERSYGCSMCFGPFKEPITSCVRINVQGKHYFDTVLLELRFTVRSNRLVC